MKEDDKPFMEEADQDEEKCFSEMESNVWFDPMANNAMGHLGHNITFKLIKYSILKIQL